MHQLRLIRRSHHNETGQIRQKSHVERTRMGRAIGPDQPRTIDGKAHWQALNRDIMHNLVITTLEKG